MRQYGGQQAEGSDFTYVTTWSGFVYVAFVIDAFAGASWAGACCVRRGGLSAPPRSTDADSALPGREESSRLQVGSAPAERGRDLL